jgi:MFS family permease
MDKETQEEGSLAEREAAYERFVWANLKRNYAGHYIHGMLGMTGFRLFNAPTFIPAYLQLLSGSPLLTGLGIGLQQLGGTISPIIGAAHIEHRKRVLPASMLLGTLMRVPVLAIAIAGWFLHGRTLLFSIMALLFLYGLFSGPQGVAFQFLLAKGIPITLRGRLQAWRNVTGGLIAALLAYFAGKYLIGPNAFGNGYSTTFLLAFILTSLGLTVFRLLFREPVPPTVRPKMKVSDRVRQFPEMLRADRGFLYFMISRTFAIAGRVSVPFFILYAGKTIHITGANLGLLSFAYLIADTATNLIWGYMADRNGFKSAFVAALVLWIAGTVLIMTTHTLTLVTLSFFLVGAANSGYQMSAQNIVFEFGHRDDMAMRLALSNTAESVMSALGPLAVGLIVNAFGYLTVFSLAILSELIALGLLVWLVEEPRKRRSVHGFPSATHAEPTPERGLAPEAVVLASEEDIPT